MPLRGVSPFVGLLALAFFAACGADDPAGPQGEDKPVQPPTAPPKGMSQVAWGERLFSKYGCVACHSIGGFAGAGPSLDGTWGRKRRFADGSQGTVDAAYVRESILQPDAKVVEGADATMPSYEGQLSKAQLDALVTYLETLR